MREPTGALAHSVRAGGGDPYTSGSGSGSGSVSGSSSSSGAGSGCGRCPPTVVVETIGFTVLLGPWIKKALVVITFLQLWSGSNAQTIVFVVFSDHWVEKPLVFLRC